MPIDMFNLEKTTKYDVRTIKQTIKKHLHRKQSNLIIFYSGDSKNIFAFVKNLGFF